MGCLFGSLKNEIKRIDNEIKQVHAILHIMIAQKQLYKELKVNKINNANNI